MERFTTLITESYNKEQELINLLGDYGDAIRVLVEPDFVEISFKPNFYPSFDKVGDILLSINNVIPDFPNIDKIKTDEVSWELRLKKA